MHHNKFSYSQSIIQWSGFLLCWRLKYSLVDPIRIVPMLGSFVEQDVTAEIIESSASKKVEKIVNAIEETENKLKLRFPKSYKDFLTAYEYCHQYSNNISNDYSDNDVRGFFYLDQIQTLNEYDSSFIEIYNDTDGDQPSFSSDEKYLIYGIEQDDSAFRTCYFKDAIVIGEYEDSYGAIILLYQALHSEGGEWETAIIYHSGSFRTPLFAEMARQLSYYEVGSFTDGHMPPYSQKKLTNSCASKLTFENIWWK